MCESCNIRNVLQWKKIICSLSCWLGQKVKIRNCSKVQSGGVGNGKYEDNHSVMKGWTFIHCGAHQEGSQDKQKTV